MSEINTKTEQKIIDYLEKNGPSMLGEVVKELKLSYTNGLRTIKKLQARGIIKHASTKVGFALNSK